MMAQFKDAPKLFLAARLKELVDSKAPYAPEGFAAAFADYLLTDRSDPFMFDDGQDGEMEIDISQAEMDDVIASTWDFVTNDIPQIVSTSIDKSAKLILKSLRRDWPAQRAFQIEAMSGFRERLELRWGAGFDILRMMYTIATEMGAEAHQRARRSRAKTNLVLRDTLIQLHVRACQVVAEIICLIENGFADGAMARWRTLHEIVVVAAVIAKHGEPLATRYRAHEAVEAKRAMNRYRTSHAALGYAPPSAKAVTDVEHGFAAALTQYGNNFGSDYGWAAHHLGGKPRFIDLLAEADKLEMRSHYGMASYNVHASPKGIAFRLGLIHGPGEPRGLAGSSNIGFVEPAQNAAFDLTFITSLILSRRRLDRSIELKILMLLRDQISGKLDKSHKGVVKAHRAEVKKRSSKSQKSPRATNYAD